MPRPLKLATFCAVFPLITGTLIYLIWLITRSEIMVIAGLSLLWIGTLMFFVGLGGVLHHFDCQRKLAPENRKLLTRKVILIVLLLVSNFPAAALYTRSAMKIMFGYTVHVVNKSGSMIESLIISGPGGKQEIGPIPPNTDTSKDASGPINSFRTAKLEFRMKQGGQYVEGVLDENGKNVMGASATLVILPGGKFEITRND